MRLTGLMDFDSMLSSCDVVASDDGTYRVQVFIRIHTNPVGHLFVGELRTHATCHEVRSALEREFPEAAWACRHQLVLSPPGQSSSSVDL